MEASYTGEAIGHAKIQPCTNGRCVRRYQCYLVIQRSLGLRCRAPGRAMLDNYSLWQDVFQAKPGSRDDGEVFQ